MPETLPRWGMPDVNFIETDPEKIKSDIINRYETAAGRTLSAGDPVRLFLLTIASEIIQLRQVFNHGAQQNLLTYAQGPDNRQIKPSRQFSSHSHKRFRALFLYLQGFR